MSRRARANAERQIATVTRGGSKAGTVEMAVYVPQRRGLRRARTFALYARGDDPNKPNTSGRACKSKRLSRAAREAKQNYGTLLYESVDGQWQRVVTEEVGTSRLYRSPNDIVGDWAPKKKDETPRKPRRGTVDWGEKNQIGETLGEILVDIIQRKRGFACPNI